MDGVTPVQAGSPCHIQLEYDLQCISKASTLRILKAMEISNPALTVQFERRLKNALILDSWLDLELLSHAPNDEVSVIKNGFTCTPDLAFPVGPVDLNSSLYLRCLNAVVSLADICLEDGEGKRMRRFLLCKVAIGRAFCAQRQADTTAPLPEGYDSYYLDPDQNGDLTDLSFCLEKSLSSVDKPGISTSVIQFYVKQSAQILPRYIIEFEYDPKLEKQSRQRAPCENCEADLATMYCQADAALLCQRCDLEIHKTKLASRHLRLSLEKGPQCVKPCRMHPERTAEFFCPTCHLLVCLNCKMIGHHSTGDSVKHPLVSVTEAYQSVLESAHAPDPVIDEKKKALVQQLYKIEKKGQSILQNAKTVREQIDAAYQKALSELNTVTNKRLLVLKGDAQEFKRTLSDIDRIREYLSYLETGRDATLFLLSWHQYLQAKADLPLLASNAMNHVKDTHESPFFMSGSLSIQTHESKVAPGTLPNGSYPATPSDGASMKQSTFSLSPLIANGTSSDHYQQRTTPSLFRSSSLRLDGRNTMKLSDQNSPLTQKSLGGSTVALKELDATKV